MSSACSSLKDKKKQEKIHEPMQCSDIMRQVLGKLKLKIQLYCSTKTEIKVNGAGCDIVQHIKYISR